MTGHNKAKQVHQDQVMVLSQIDLTLGMDFSGGSSSDSGTNLQQ